MMNKAVRLSGLLLVLGSILFGTVIMAGALLNLVGHQSNSPLSNISLMLSSILLLLSFPGMYFKQASETGWVGLAGYLLLQIGILLPLVATTPQLRNPSYNPPPGGDNAVDGLLAVAFILGLLLTGIATLRAGVYPRLAGILLLITMFGFFFDFFVAEGLPSVVSQISIALLGILLALAFAWIGVAMLNSRLLQSKTAAENGSSSPVGQS